MLVRNVTSAFVLLLSAASFGAGKSHVVATSDQYSGMREWYLRVSTHHCPGVQSTDEWGAHLDFSAFEQPDHSITFAITPELSQRSAFKPHGRAVLDTLVDGVPAEFNQSADAFVKHHGSHKHKSVEETIPFALGRADVDRMSHGLALQFRVSTRSGVVERCAYAKDLQDLADFVAQAQFQ